MSTTKQLSWPERFAVTIVTVQGQPSRYTVTTWLHEHKAVALAVARHEARYSETSQGRLYDVQVERLGPAPRGEQGVVAPSRSDLIDRNEW